ncbi:MAG TPA: hypothetical protein VFP65_27715 [Anaeromyxobacteraceae bacterium]|nr:hypothetical protein [Anaeromyxobacteraceae bacterium]
MRHIQDRGEVVHFAGFHALSPALAADGSPAFSAGAGDGLARCGWATFFTAMESRGLAVAFDPADATSARFVKAVGARGEGEPHGGLGAAVAHSRRFWGALFPGKSG